MDFEIAAGRSCAASRDLAAFRVQFKSLPAPSGTPSPHSGGVGESILDFSDSTSWKVSTPVVTTQRWRIPC
jgi:hypothetical protein